MEFRDWILLASMIINVCLLPLIKIIRDAERKADLANTEINNMKDRRKEDLRLWEETHKDQNKMIDRLLNLLKDK